MYRLQAMLLIVLALFAAVPTPAQERFSFFQASTPESVERMLTFHASGVESMTSG